MKQTEHQRVVQTKKGRKPVTVNRGNRKRLARKPSQKLMPKRVPKFDMRRGFLLERLLLADGKSNKRWQFWAKAQTNGLLPSKIPQINFDDFPHPETYKMLVKNVVFKRHESSSFVDDFMDWVLWGFRAPGAEKPRASKERQQYWFENFKVEEMIMHPADYWQIVFSEQTGQAGVAGWFGTPMSIVKLMTEITAGSGHHAPYKSTHEPCVGTGPMLLLASNHSLDLSGFDVSPRMIKSAKIAAYMYVPWLIAPFPDVMLTELKIRLSDKKTPVKPVVQMKGPRLQIRNSLTDPVTGYEFCTGKRPTKAMEEKWRKTAAKKAAKKNGNSN